MSDRNQQHELAKLQEQAANAGLKIKTYCLVKYGSGVTVPEVIARRMSDAQPCTCHPDDNPPQPCARKYALSECVETRPHPESSA